MKEIDDETKQLKYFSQYEIAVDCDLLPGERQYVGEKDRGFCRFCNRAEPEVSFRKIAHALPEFIGNKSLFAYDECDDCNQRFSHSVESHLANWLGPRRTSTQLRGKSGIPSYKAKDGVSRVDIEDGAIQITALEDATFAEIDIESRTLTLNTVRPSYIPVAAFKCFVKRAVSIAPKDLLEEMDHLIRWITDSEHQPDTLPAKPLLLLEQTIPGQKPFGELIKVMLFRRKFNHMPVPYLQLLVAYGNWVHQVVLPMPRKDRRLSGRPVTLMYFPSPISESRFGPPVRRKYDLSGYDWVRGEPVAIHWGFERHEQILTGPHEAG